MLYVLPVKVLSGFFPATSYSEIMAEGGEVRVFAIMRHLPPGDCWYAEKMMWGAGGKCPKTNLARLFMECSGRGVFVDGAVYGDLSNVESVEVVQDEGRYKVIIKGGEPSSGYIASLEILSADVWHSEGEVDLGGTSNQVMVYQRVVSKSISPRVIEERGRYVYGKIARHREGCGAS